MQWKSIMIETTERLQFVNITAKVAAEVLKSGVQEGVCYLYVPHTTAAVTINENADPDVVKDLTASLSKLIPADGNYLHAEGNSDAHLKSSLFGATLTIPVSGGKLMMGKWQAVYFCEFDGPRQRNFKIAIF